METLQGICPEGVCIIHLQYMFNAMRTKIAFLDISIHKETKSADFFITLLQQKYGLDNVDIFYDYSFEKKIGKFDYIKDIKEYHTIVFWQKLPSPKILYMLRDKKVIYIPMYDDWHPYKRFLSYLKTFNVRVICFSSRIYNFVYNILHVESLYIQYYISPLPYLVDYTHKKIFRWYRGNISRGDIKKILGDQKIDKLTIKNAPSSFYKKLHITLADIKKYKIQIVSGFSNRQENYHTLLADHNIFIAPRPKEGIGMSFLEALSIGMCVVGYNDATMNEYIEHGKDGLLTNFSEELDLNLYTNLGQAAKSRYFVGHKKRQQERENIIEFIEKASHKTHIKWIPILYNGSVYYIANFVAYGIRKIKLFLKRLYR